MAQTFALPPIGLPLSWWLLGAIHGRRVSQ
jgi:hypothetical protein